MRQCLLGSRRKLHVLHVQAPTQSPNIMKVLLSAILQVLHIGYIVVSCLLWIFFSAFEAQAPVFTYERLASSNGGDIIRVIDILPGNPSSPITSRLRTIRLSDSSVQYDGLSYCWRDTKEILCNGGRLKMTQSLYAAVSRLRERARGRSYTVWADGIYINQEDNATNTTYTSEPCTYHTQLTCHKIPFQVNSHGPKPQDQTLPIPASTTPLINHFIHQTQRIGPAPC